MSRRFFRLMPIPLWPSCPPCPEPLPGIGHPARTAMMILDTTGLGMRRAFILTNRALRLLNRHTCAMFIATASALLIAPSARSQCTPNIYGDVLCPTADSRCLKDLFGDWWCSTPGGGIELDRTRSPVCGPGACVTDLRGDIKCSSEARGFAGLDRYREAQCTGQCVPASGSACVRLK